MNKVLLRYSVFALVIGALVYSGYLLLAPAITKTVPTENVEKEHHSEAVEMSDAKVAAAGIELLKASPGVLRVESNQSLTSYELKASLAGTVIDRQTTLGEYVSEQKPAFVIADLSTVWVDFSVYRRDLNRVSVGDQVLIDPADGGPPIEAKITYLAPIGSSDTQSALARATVQNPDRRLRPGLFITGRLTLSAKKVNVAVKSSALQTFENRTVIFVRNGDKFEARDVELGGRDPELVEIAFGLLEGDVYAAQNSFIVKAEMAKGSASHDH